MPIPGQPGDLGGALLTALALQAAAVLACALVGALIRVFVLARRGGHEVVRSDAEPRPRQFLRTALGSLWVLDGLLQAQPAMPSGFLPTMISPTLAGQPSWLTGIAGPLLRAWAHHPIGSDAITVWVQVGLGVLILAGGAGAFSRAVLWAALAWSALVWVVGEALGGLLVPGASWLTGAPGAVVFYGVAAALLLAPWSWWARSGWAAGLARRTVGGAMLLGALLQALPWETNWSGDTLSGIFRDASTTPQPEFLARPLTGLAGVSSDHPTVVGLVLLVSLTVVGAGLLSGRAPVVFVPAGLAVRALTWWFGQDFGVLGGTGTDPNSAVPLAVLLVTGWPGWSAKDVAEPGSPAPSSAPRLPWLALGGAAWGAGLAAVLIVPLVLGVGLIGPADAQAAVADDGGVRVLDGRTAPDFTLTDQNGRPVSLAGLRGNLVLLTFLDPVCSDSCPLIANQLASADRAAGAASAHVQIVAINTNPLFHGRDDVLTFTREHGLAALPNWHFVTGSLAQLGAALRSYGITVTVPDVGMVSHSQIVYFVNPRGNEISSMNDSAEADLTTGYTALLTAEIRAKAP
jgi:cytochrome oxidase Cu insertion factor (SCO1/SenC/PrrC family)